MSERGDGAPQGGATAQQIDENSRAVPTRHSLQPTARSSEHSQMKRHSSMSVVRKHSLGQARRPAVPDIPETETIEDEEPGLQRTTKGSGMGNSIGGSFVKNTQTRKISSISRSSSRNGHVATVGCAEKGVLNQAYDQSSRSSVHGSMTSLPVIREQYCCCQRWTRLERYLAIVVAALALVIIGLIIAVGCLAGRGQDVTGPFSFVKF